MPKNAAAANVSHIGKVADRQSWSSDVAQAQFMRDVPQHSIARIRRKQMPISAGAKSRCASDLLMAGAIRSTEAGAPFDQEMSS
jgi:hypothetical protein